MEALEKLMELIKGQDYVLLLVSLTSAILVSPTGNLLFDGNTYSAGVYAAPRIAKEILGGISLGVGVFSLLVFFIAPIIGHFLLMTFLRLVSSLKKNKLEFLGVRLISRKIVGVSTNREHLPVLVRMSRLLSSLLAVVLFQAFWLWSISGAVIYLAVISVCAFVMFDEYLDVARMGLDIHEGGGN